MAEDESTVEIVVVGDEFVESDVIEPRCNGRCRDAGMLASCENSGEGLLFEQCWLDWSTCSCRLAILGASSTQFVSILKIAFVKGEN